MIAKVEWHPGELYPRVGFIVTNLTRPPERVVAFYNTRGTCEQWIKEGKGEIKWTRLSCRTFAANAVRLQLHALAYNLGNFLRTLATSEPIKNWSLSSLKEKLIKIGAKVVSHGRYVAFQMAEVAIPRQMFQEILRLIAELRPQPPPASMRPSMACMQVQSKIARSAARPLIAAYAANAISSGPIRSNHVVFCFHAPDRPRTKGVVGGDEPNSCPRRNIFSDHTRRLRLPAFGRERRCEVSSSGNCQILQLITHWVTSCRRTIIAPPTNLRHIQRRNLVDISKF